jgi:membrane-anchored protein YejM (alkaline phosphatase superfamily)
MTVEGAARSILTAERVALNLAGRLSGVATLTRRFAERTNADDAVESAIANMETAWRMQAAVPELTDLSAETPATHRLYGTDSLDARTAAYARQCLLARRLVERGVRFVELSTLAANLGGGNGANPWDHHSALERGHGLMARQVDQPIAGLLRDLKCRGLLDQTLVIFAGEFGRTPFSQGSDGRDHNPQGFSIWMAGGGLRGGVVHGATDDLGYHAVQDVTTFYDVWATALHLLGLDHERLTYRFGGRDFRLTDVHGNVLRDLLA